MEWSRKRLAELLRGAEARLEGGAAGGLLTRVTALRSCTGEAMLTTRKGNKRFAFYDLKLTVAWEAVPAAAAAEARAADGAAADGAAAAGVDAADAGGEQQGGGAAPAAPAPSSSGISGEISVGEFGSGSDHDDLELGFTVNGELPACGRVRFLCTPAWPVRQAVVASRGCRVLAAGC